MAHHQPAHRILRNERKRRYSEFDDPLETVRGYWESEVTGYDHSGEMGHMLWRVQEDIGDDTEQQEKKPFTKDEITVDPVMDFSGKEIVAYIEQ